MYPYDERRLRRIDRNLKIATAPSKVVAIFFLAPAAAFFVAAVLAFVAGKLNEFFGGCF